MLKHDYAILPMDSKETTMAKNINSVFILLTLLITFTDSAAGELQSTPDTRLQTPSPEVVKLREHLYRIGQVTVDTNKREASMNGWVNMNDGLIEYLACSLGGKLHESALVLDVKPTVLQVALILLGLEAESDFQYQGSQSLPKGDPVEIWVEWNQEGETKRVRAEDLVFDTRKNKPMAHTHWVFTGSIIHAGRFLAEVEKSLIATYHDPTAIINNPLPEGADDTVYSVNQKLVPPKDTPITLTIKAIGERQVSSSLSSKTDIFADILQDKGEALFQENFDEGYLDITRWNVTRDGDFNQFAVDVKDVDPTRVLANSAPEKDYRLRLMVNTLGISGSEKSLGVRSMNKFDFSQAQEISFDLDWNNQPGDFHLTAGFYLCPVESENPRKEEDWIGLEWVGMPQDQNIPINLLESSNGSTNQLSTDFGSEDKNGKLQKWTVKSGSHRIKILFDSKAIRVWVDSYQICHAKHSLGFTSGYIYLQLSSGSKHSSREVYFDNIVVIKQRKSRSRLELSD